LNKRNFFLQNIKLILEKNKIDIKNIAIDRPYPALLDDVPIVCIYSSDEDHEKRSGGGGNEYIVDTYRNQFDVNIDMIMDNEKGADFKLNEVCSQIEDALNTDIFFKDITGESQGDNEGLKLKGSKPYNFDVGAEKSYAATTLSISTQYITDAIPNKRLDELEGFDGDIKIGDDSDTPPMEVEIDINI